MTDIVVDACCLINLLAAGEILRAHSSRKAKGEGQRLPATLHVPTTVANEALYILQPDPDDSTTLVKTAIDLSTPKQLGLIHDCDIEGHDESSLFVQLAVRLDDGEAACLATAKNRSWTLATDDRVAAKLAGELQVEVVNTAQMIKMWSAHMSANDEAVSKAISNIQSYAKFVPRKQSAEFHWWNDHAKES
jgi:predicted nucleic acid-binding protein